MYVTGGGASGLQSADSQRLRFALRFKSAQPADTQPLVY